VFLPPYSTNLHLIERLWKYFHIIVLHNKHYEKYYATFEEFKKAYKSFFIKIKRYNDEILSLMT